MLNPISYDLMSNEPPRAHYDLTLASWLFDLAWDAYYDAPGTYTNSSYGVANFVPSHGFTVDAYISNTDTDTHAWVVRNGSRVVVAFRGTNSRTNVNVDLTICRSTAQFGEKHDQSIADAIPGVRLVLPQVHKVLHAASGGCCGEGGGGWLTIVGLCLRMCTGILERLHLHS